MTGIHPRLAAAFAALDATSLRWCLLRGRDDLTAPSGDVDLLFHPEDADRARRALADAELPALRVWAGGTQNFFLGWDRGTERWVYVHAMTEIAFGPFHALRFDGVDGIFARLERVEGVPMPGAADRFWITLLHGLLDKGSVKEEHRTALATLAPAARVEVDLARLVDRIAPQGWTAAAVRDAAHAGRWEELEALSPALLAGWRRLDRTAAVRSAAHRASLLMTKLRETVTRRGLCVALLAPDGAGKSTLAEALAGALFFPVRRFYLGLEGGRFANSSPSPIPGLGILRRLVYLWRSWLAARYHQARRRFVIFDRYPYEALLPPSEGVRPWSVARRRLLGHALPAPDVVLVLDAPGEILRARKAEHTIERLERDRQGYLALARRLSRVVVLDATRPAADVRRDAVEAVWRICRRRFGAR